MNYYSISVYSKINNPIRVGGYHIIRAKSDIEALKIREKYGISNPMFAKGELKINCRLMDLNNIHDSSTITRRHVGIGGKIWYEDIDETLKHE